MLDEMGTLLEVQGENPFRCRAYHNAAQALGSCRRTSRNDRRRPPRPGAGDRRDDVREDRPAGDDRTPPGVRRPAQSDAAGSGRAVARAGTGAQEDQGACTTPCTSRAWPTSARRPRRARSPTLKGFGAKTEAKILRRDQLHRIGRRPHLAEHGPTAGRADHRGRPRPSRA